MLNEDEESKPTTMYHNLFGYIEVNTSATNSELSEMSIPKMKLTGTVNNKNLRDKIEIQIKTFYGKRKIYSFEIGISQQIKDLIKMLVDLEQREGLETQDKWPYNHQYRLINTKMMIEELNPYKTIAEAELRPDQVLILLDPKKVYWHLTRKGPGVYVENNGTMAIKQGEGDDHQLVQLDQGFNAGQRYFEINLLTEPCEKTVVFGVCSKSADISLNFSEIKGFYGYILSDCKKISNNNGRVDCIDYGEPTKIMDKIGVLMEFLPEGLQISFYVNKISMGIAFQNILIEEYAPCCYLGFDGTQVKITNRVPFPNL